MELPGVKKGSSDLSIVLATNTVNRIRQVTVRGTLRPIFPVLTTTIADEGSGAGVATTIRERRYGNFARSFVVPLDTKVCALPP